MRGTTNGFHLSPQAQSWLRWVMGAGVAAAIMWFGIDARVQVLEERISDLQYQVRQVEAKIDRYLVETWRQRR